MSNSKDDPEDTVEHSLPDHRSAQTDSPLQGTTPLPPDRLTCRLLVRIRTVATPLTPGYRWERFSYPTSPINFMATTTQIAAH